MKYILDPLKGLLCSLFGVFSRIWIAFIIGASAWHWQQPWLMALTLPALGFIISWASIKWDTAYSPGGDGGAPSVTIRGDMRIGKSIYQTPDERFPGDITQPAVGRWLQNYGKWVCAFLWAGDRNVAQGLARVLGKEVSGYMPDGGDGYWANEEVWRYDLPIFGVLRLVVGWQVIRALDKKFIGVPLFTLKHI